MSDSDSKRTTPATEVAASAVSSDAPSPDALPDLAKAQEKATDTNGTAGRGGDGDAGGGGGGGLFGGWGMPDMNAVADGIGGIFGQVTDSVGAGGQDAAAANRGGLVDVDSWGANDLSDVGTTTHPDGTGVTDELGKKAADIAKGATKELENVSKVAQEKFGQAAVGLEQGWGSLNTFLDDILAPKQDQQQQHQRKDVSDELEVKGDIQVKFQSLFPDADANEDVVDHYVCVMLQKYRCYLNDATPEKTIPLRVRLFVTTSTLAVHVFDDGGAFNDTKVTVTVPFTDIARVQRGAKAMMRVLTKQQQSYIFGDFASDTHFEGALSLVEHMIASSVDPGDGGDGGDDNDDAPADGDGEAPPAEPAPANDSAADKAAADA